MKYLTFVATSGGHPADEVAEMNRDWPAYAEQTAHVWHVGRELDIRRPATTVRRRGEETLVTDGPFIETKEFIGGVEVVECDDLDAAVELQLGNPVARFCPFEIRPFRGEAALGAALDTFDLEHDRSDRIPYLFTVWADGSEGAGANDVLPATYAAWQQALDARGVLVLGGALQGPEAAVTLRARERVVGRFDGPLNDRPETIVAVDVVNCASRGEAVEHALGHPLARSHAVEVRAFHSEAAAEAP